MEKIKALFIKKIKSSTRKELQKHIKRIVNKYNLSYAGFVTKVGGAAGRPLIYYPKNLTIQKELCGKTVGIVNEITDLKISNMENFSEITLSNAQEFLYLKEVISPILFYCVSNSKLQLKKVRKFISKNEEQIKEIFTKD
ncbi:MAG: hypothetical protein R6U96_05195 [Promethearchaeia archaeon]